MPGFPVHRALGNCQLARIVTLEGENLCIRAPKTRDTGRGNTRLCPHKESCIFVFRSKAVAPGIGWMQASDGCKNVAMWSLWTLYICLAVAVSIGRGDGPRGQGFSSVRVEALLSKMTLEDKVRAQPCFFFPGWLFWLPACTACCTSANMLIGFPLYLWVVLLRSSRFIRLRAKQLLSI